MSADWFKDASLRAPPPTPQDFDLFEAPMQEAPAWAASVSEDPTTIRTCEVQLSEIGELPHLLFAAIRQGDDITSKDVVPILDTYLSAACPSCFAGVDGNTIQLISSTAAGGVAGGVVLSSSSQFGRLASGQCPFCDSKTYIAVWHGEARTLGNAAPASFGVDEKADDQSTLDPDDVDLVRSAMSDAREQAAAPAPQPASSGFKLWMLIPAMGMLAVLAVFMMRLYDNDTERLPSVLINKQVPEFALAPLYDGAPGLAKADLSAPGVKLLNIWASWCGPCRVEHPNIEALAAEGVTVHGLNYKDAPENARNFLTELGDPYTLIGADRNGRTGIEFGVYGVPETFVINADGVIVYKHVGPVLQRDMERMRAAIAAAASTE